MSAPAAGGRPRCTFVFLSQVYVPDPAAVGQYIASAAEELVARGHRVVVITSARGYDDPSVRYSRRETLAGVEVRRLPFCSFGKGSLLVRLLAGVSFVAQSIVATLRLARVDAVVVSTTPPLVPIAALVISHLRSVAVKYRVMDLNPDQLIALRVLRPDSLAVRIFDWLNRRVLARASDRIVLDRFMAERIVRKLSVASKLTIIPPWPLEDHMRGVPRGQNSFRREHHLDDAFVVMYSGNHGPSNPLTTVLEAARRLENELRLRFVFVGDILGAVALFRSVLTLAPDERARMGSRARDLVDSRFSQDMLRAQLCDVLERGLA